MSIRGDSDVFEETQFYMPVLFTTTLEKEDLDFYLRNTHPGELVYYKFEGCGKKYLARDMAEYSKIHKFLCRVCLSVRQNKEGLRYYIRKEHPEELVSCEFKDCREKNLPEDKAEYLETQKKSFDAISA